VAAQAAEGATPACAGSAPPDPLTPDPLTPLTPDPPIPLTAAVPFSAPAYREYTAVTSAICELDSARQALAISLTPANLALAAPDIPILNLTPDGKPLTFPLALSGPDRHAWIERDVAELRKLFVTLKCLVPSLSPAKKPTCYKRVVKEKWNYEALKIKRRVRGTAGGDRLECPYTSATPTASMTLVKCLLNAVVSEDAHFGTLDITDYYLGADVPEEDM